MTQQQFAKWVIFILTCIFHPLGLIFIFLLTMLAAVIYSA